MLAMIRERSGLILSMLRDLLFLRVIEVFLITLVTLINILLETGMVNYLYVRRFIQLMMSGLLEGVLLAPITRILVVLKYNFQWLNIYLLPYGLSKI